MTIRKQAAARNDGGPLPRDGWREMGRVVSVAALTVMLGVAGTASTGAANADVPFDVFQGATEAAPIRFGAGIPLEVFVKVGGSEAQVLQDPVARGAGMLIDTRITQLASLLIFGTVPAPPVALPSPTVAETIWTAGSASPQTADASAVPGGIGTPGQPSSSDPPLSVGTGQARAEAAEGPRGAGHAAYTDLALAPAGVKNAVRAREVGSDSVAIVTAETVETSSVAVTKGMSLLDGTVTIEGIRSSAKAVTTGRPGGATAEGSFEMGRVAALGKTAEITADGIRITDTSLPLPIRDAINKQLQEKLSAFGASIKLLPPQRNVKDDGSFASVQSAGIAVRMAASAAQPINPVLGDLSFNMTLGLASADASASRSSDFGGFTPGSDAELGSGLSTANPSGALPTIPGPGLSGETGLRTSEPDSAVYDDISQTPDYATGSGQGPLAEPGDGQAALAEPAAHSTLAASQRVRKTSNWWALSFVVLLGGFITVVGLQALPRLARPRVWQ